MAACGSNNGGGNGDGSGGDGGGPGFGGLGGDGSNGADGSGTSGDGGPCTGLQCQQVTCPSGGKTTVTGTVHDPAGKVALYNVVVYVPEDRTPLPPIPTGASCDRCGGTLPGRAVAATLTDVTGHFTLENVPVGSDIPLVIQVGKWRRQLKIPGNVEACKETPITDADLTRLPRSQSEGDLPRIALTTGGADPLECLLRKIGIADTEFTPETGKGRVNLYAGSDAVTVVNGMTYVQGRATNSYAAGGSFTAAQTLWSDESKLKNYDMVLLACEGQYTRVPETKPQAALDAMYAFASEGGRIFASHYHDYWFAKGPHDFPSTASWLLNTCGTDPQTCGPVDQSPGYHENVSVDTGFPKGNALADWLVNVKASTTRGVVDISQPRTTVTATTAASQRWLYGHFGAPASDSVQYLTFNTPVAAADADKCGRAVYSDLHVSSQANGDKVGQPFPSGCIATELSAQEKVLEFMLFDLSSCIQNDSTAPVAPPTIR
jgi:hypothetical protein